MTTSESKDYYDLTEPNIIQKIIFLIIFILATYSSFSAILPLLENFFNHYLAGVVSNTGDSISYLLESKSELRETSYFTNWSIDIYKGTPQEGRYWLNPILALIIPCAFIGLAISFVFSAFIPKSIGLIRQKIEREIAAELDRLTLKVFGIHSKTEKDKIVKMLIDADLRDIHDFERSWKMPVEDIISIREALLWQNGNALNSIKRFLSAIKFYMKFYVTKKYANFILGLVYFGAAVLIIIIGLRGLKFIPAQEPSLVFFSLGLEFCLLVTYAITLMFGKDENENESYSSEELSSDRVLLGREFSSGKETEELLKMFIVENDKNEEKL
jgi:hypothetical protein